MNNRKYIKDYSDDEIARGEYELTKVYDQYFPLIHNVCSRYYLRLYDLDDLHQEALIVCFQSLAKYNSSFHVSFGSFYKVNLERHFCSLLRREKSQKRTIDQISTSYEQFTEDHSGEVCDNFINYNVETTMLTKIEFNNILLELSNFEKKVLRLHITTYKSVREIAEELNVKADKIYSTLNHIKKELQHRLNE